MTDRTVRNLESHRTALRICYPFYYESLSIFEMALRYFVDSHITGCSNRLFIDYKDKTVCFRDFGKPIPFENMRKICNENRDGISIERWDNKLHGLSAWNQDVPFFLMGLCKKNVELTSFSAGKCLTARSLDNARCGKLKKTCEPDGIEIRIVHEKAFEAAYLDGMILQFHALFPDLEIVVNRKRLQKSNGLPGLLYQKLNPTRGLESLCSYRSSDLDFAAAKQYFPNPEGGPFLISYLNGYETYRGGDHCNIVMDLLHRFRFPFEIRDLCIIFHCKDRGGEGTFFMSTCRDCMEFTSKTSKEEFEKKIIALFKEMGGVMRW